MSDTHLDVKRDQPGKWASLALTVAVHVGLIAFLVLGIRWQSSPPAPMQVDLVAAPPVHTAPPAEPAPEPKPEPAPEPKPEPKPEPPKPQPEPPKPKVAPPPPKPEPKPEIATKAPDVKKPPKPEPKPEPPKPEPKKPEPPKPEPKKPEAKPEPKPEPRKPEPKKPKPDKPKAMDDYLAQRLAQETAQTAARSQLERMMREDATRASAARSKAAGDIYANAIRTKVRGNLLPPPGLTGNPEAVFEVDQLPSGEVLTIRLKRSSGSAALDDAIERAIRRSSPLPLPKDAELFKRTLELMFRPLDE